MFYARIRQVGVQPKDTTWLMGNGDHKFTHLESIWPYVQKNMSSYLPGWAIPSCPPYESSMELLKHITPRTPGYVCRVHSTAVWCYRFYADKFLGGTNYILEVWDGDTDYAYPEEFHQKSDD